MDYKIVADSSVDLLDLKKVPFDLSPLKIMTDKTEYVDNQKLDVKKMTEELKVYNGRSSSSCPSVSDWLDAFGNAKYIFCITITSRLSGSYNSACLAKTEYEGNHPNSKVFVIDSLSAGPELKLIAEKIEHFILEDMEFEEICTRIKEYQSKTNLLFCLESLTNLANNGRVSNTVAKIAGILGIRLIGKASDVGQLEPLNKSRGEKKALTTLLKTMSEMGYKGGKVRISHCFNAPFAKMISDALKDNYGTKDIQIYNTKGLCSFYAEKGGILIGFEN